MTTSLISRLPYGPALHPVSVFSVHHLKYALDDLVAPGDIQSPDSFPGTLSACRMVGGGIMLMASLPADTMVRHEWQHLSDLSADDVIATVVLAGTGSVSQHGIDLQFQTGDVFYRKARLPSAVRVDQACRFLLLRFSFGRFSGAHVKRFSDFVPSLARRDSQLRQALWQYVEHVLPSLASSSVNTVHHAEQAFISLLSAVYSESQQCNHTDNKTDIRWELLVSTLDTLLYEPDLTVTDLSRALGISTRLVHRLFELNGHRYSSYLLSKRLARAHADLSNPQYAQVPVSEIAYRAGFNNASHFSRSFKQVYGAAPSAYRSAGALAA